MDKIEQLYNLYTEQGLISSATSLEDFAAADDDIKDKLYELGSGEELFITTSIDDFKSAWSSEPVKTEAVATETASVTAVDEAVDTDLPSEVISLEQFEVMEPAEKRKLSYGDAQRLIRERDRKEKGGLDSFDVSSSDYSKVTDEEKIKLQDEASKELLKEYEEEGVIDFEITAEQIDEKAIKLLKEKTQPSFLESLGAQTARGFAGFVKGASDFGVMVNYSLTEAALNAFDDQWKGTSEDKQALMAAKKYNINPSGVNMGSLSMASQEFISSLEP